MESRSEQLIRQLRLQPHPEGGWYREIFRSENTINYNHKKRSAFTSIYFLLELNQVSRWHKVDADEAWHFLEGAPLELHVMSPDFSKIETITLGKITEQQRAVFVVKAGWWQAAQSGGRYSLVSCNVAPGFEFSGFFFLNDDEKKTVEKHHSSFTKFV